MEEKVENKIEVKTEEITSNLQVKDEFSGLGICFVPPEKYPSEIKLVTDFEQFKKDYKAEIEWAMKFLVRTKGYSISMPQLGVEYNAAVIRLPQRLPELVFNLSISPDSNYGGKRNKRVSLEKSYSIMQGTRAFKITRYKKVFVNYINEDGKKINVVHKFPKNTHDSSGVIFQSAAWHMNRKNLFKD